MPGWQQFYEEYGEQIEVVVIAQDAQGAEVARPWVEKAGGTYRALLDQHNAIGKAYNVKFVPVGIFVDEEGRLVRAVGSVNIDKGTLRGELVEWITSGMIPSAWRDADKGAKPRALTADEQAADAKFQRAIALLKQGKREDAVAELKRAYVLDPKNWLIRKQLWAIENPGMFYDGKVDYRWQKEQMAREDEELKK